MKQFLAPLGIFAMGNIALLFVILFFPAIGTATTDLAAASAGWTHWGWAWVVSSAKLLVFIFLELCILFATGKAFLATRNN